MPVKITTTNVRLSTDTAWHKPSTAQANYIKTNYTDTGKRTEVSATGENGLTKVKVVTFASTSVKSEWDADSTIDTFIDERKTYNRSNRITFEQKVENV